MKAGLKLWSTNDFYIEESVKLFKENIFGYIELFTVPGSFGYIDFWKDINIPFILHAPHSLAGLNPADKFSRKDNLNIVRLTEEYRKALNPKYIIFHPGLNGSLDEAVFQFKSIFNQFPEIQKIALIENKPSVGINGEKCVGVTPQEIRSMIELLNVGFCMDIGHCICAANSLNYTPLSMIENFLELHPLMFHLSDGDFKSEMDTHLNYGNGNYPFVKILGMLPESPMITIETEKNSLSSLESFVNDVKYLNDLKF